MFTSTSYSLIGRDLRVFHSVSNIFSFFKHLKTFNYPVLKNNVLFFLAINSSSQKGFGNFFVMPPDNVNNYQLFCRVVELLTAFLLRNQVRNCFFWENPCKDIPEQNREDDRPVISCPLPHTHTSLISFTRESFNQLLYTLDWLKCLTNVAWTETSYSNQKLCISSG